MEQTIAFGIFMFLAVLAVGLAIVVVTARSVFRSAIALTAVLGVIGGLFALLGADFVAAGQLLIYVGGIMIIMLFVVMFSQQPREALGRQTNDQWFPAMLFSAAVAVGLILQLRAAFEGPWTAVDPRPTTAALGRLLLRDMVVPFEAISLVLLAALIGAILFGQDKRENP